MKYTIYANFDLYFASIGIDSVFPLPPEVTPATTIFRNMKLTATTTAAIAFIFSEAVYAAPGKTDSAFRHILESRDNRCGPDVGSCGEGECCSESGYCGTSTDYCAGSQCQLDYSYSCDTQYVKTLT